MSILYNEPRAISNTATPPKPKRTSHEQIVQRKAQGKPTTLKRKKIVKGYY
jgi:hypothetical protein